MEARDAISSLKMLTKLQLTWGDDDSRSCLLEKEVFNELQPHSNKLKWLGVKRYKGMGFPNWVADPSFHHLFHVSLFDCENCVSLPTLGQLPSLKELFIQGMDAVKAVGSEFSGTCTVVSFPSLELLVFQDMSGWKVWSKNNSVVFPRLQELRIENCPDLIDLSVDALPSLRVLIIRGCHNGVLRSLVQAAPSVSSLDIRSISGLTNEVWGDVTQHLGAVEDLFIMECNEIRYLWEPKATYKILVSLKKLDVCKCKNLLSLGKGDEENLERSPSLTLSLVSSLRMLKVVRCDSMSRCCCPNSIERLTIFHCSSLTSVSFQTSTLPFLVSVLRIGGLKRSISEWGSQNFPTSVVELMLLDEPHVSNFHDLVELLPSSLTQLKLNEFHDLETLSVGLYHLKSLQHLQIEKCPKVKDLPETLLPTLLTLSISGSPNLIEKCNGRGSQFWPLISHIPCIYM